MDDWDATRELVHVAKPTAQRLVRSQAPLIALANRITTTHAVNTAMSTHYTPEQVEDLPADLIAVCLALVAPPDKG
jgi:hypothetical protein